MNNKVIHIDFDGFGKTPQEAAEMMIHHLKTGHAFDSIQIFIPTQWSWGAMQMLHPAGGLMSILNRDADIKGKYNLSCSSNCGKIGVTAIPI